MRAFTTHDMVTCTVGISILFQNYVYYSRLDRSLCLSSLFLLPRDNGPKDATDQNHLANKVKSICGISNYFIASCTVLSWRDIHGSGETDPEGWCGLVARLRSRTERMRSPTATTAFPRTAACGGTPAPSALRSSSPSPYPLHIFVAPPHMALPLEVYPLVDARYYCLRVEKMSHLQRTTCPAV